MFQEVTLSIVAMSNFDLSENFLKSFRLLPLSLCQFIYIKLLQYLSTYIFQYTN